MRIEALRDERRSDFIKYCKRYREEICDSYLSDQDLHEMELNEENPTYILLNDKDKIIGVISLIIDDYFKKGKKGRFRILHSVKNDKESYSLMINAILPHTKEINRVFVFAPENNERFRGILEKLDFQIERYSFLLVRDNHDVSKVSFDEGYKLKTFQFNKDEEDFCSVRNPAFANLAGSSVPVTPEIISKMQEYEDYLEGGIKLLYHNEKPVGLIRLSKEIEKGITYAFIGPLAIIPEYQGRGLGRKLLRVGLDYGKSKGLSKAMLSVNAENDSAVTLYLQEGFERERVMICYNYNVK